MTPTRLRIEHSLGLGSAKDGQIRGSFPTSSLQQKDFPTFNGMDDIFPFNIP